MRRSVEKRDWFTGKPYTQHYDDSGQKTGTSETKSDWFSGRDHVQHYDSSGQESGKSETRSDIVTGRRYEQHFDSSGDKSGTSEHRQDWLTGGDFDQHFDPSGNKTGASRAQNDWVTGSRYTEHSGIVPSHINGSTSRPVNKHLSGGQSSNSAVSYQSDLEQTYSTSRPHQHSREAPARSNGSGELAVLVLAAILLGGVWTALDALGGGNAVQESATSTAIETLTLEPEAYNVAPVSRVQPPSCESTAMRTDTSVAALICADAELKALNDKDLQLRREEVSRRGERYSGVVSSSRASLEGTLTSCGAFGPQRDCIAHVLQEGVRSGEARLAKLDQLEIEAP